MKSIALIAVAGLATVAAAQPSNLSVNLTWDQTSIEVGQSATATVTASWTGVNNSYLSAVVVNFLASAQLGDVSNIAPFATNQPIGGFTGTGTASGADVLSYQASQYIGFLDEDNGETPQENLDRTNPITITSWTFTATALGALSYSTTTAEGVAAPFVVIGPGVTSLPAFFQNDVFSSGTLNIVPAPSAMALLGLGGLVATRRRR